jgi:hypothetical protein
MEKSLVSEGGTKLRSTSTAIETVGISANCKNSDNGLKGAVNIPTEDAFEEVIQ